LTEGDLAKSLALSGPSVVGRVRYDVFPLEGKLLNVREATLQEIRKNAEINNLIEILGLDYGKQCDDEADLKNLRYNLVLVLSDQHGDNTIMIINFIHRFWLQLLRHKIVDLLKIPNGMASGASISSEIRKYRMGLVYEGEEAVGRALDSFLGPDHIRFRTEFLVDLLFNGTREQHHGVIGYTNLISSWYRSR
jgi:hypothetical protein